MWLMTSHRLMEIHGASDRDIDNEFLKINEKVELQNKKMPHFWLHCKFRALKFVVILRFTFSFHTDLFLGREIYLLLWFCSLLHVCYRFGIGAILAKREIWIIITCLRIIFLLVWILHYTRKYIRQHNSYRKHSHNMDYWRIHQCLLEK